MGRATATVLGTVHVVRVAFWLGVEHGCRAGSIRLWHVEQRAGVRAHRAEAAVQRVTGMAA